MREQIADRNGQVVIRIHQSRGRHNHAVPVRVGIVRERDLISIFKSRQTGHGIRTGGIHANLAVVIDCHERKGGINFRIHNLDVQSVELVDGRPIVHRRATQRIDTELEARAADRLHIDDVAEILDIRQDKIFLVRGRRLDRRRERRSTHSRVSAAQQLVGSILDPLRYVRVGRSAIGRVVLDAAILGRVVRWGNNDAIGQIRLARAVVYENGPGYDGCRRHAVVLLNDRFDAIGGQHLQRGALCWSGECVRVLAHVQRAIRALFVPVVANGLRDGQDVRFGECAVERRTPMSAGAEADTLARVI